MPEDGNTTAAAAADWVICHGCRAIVYRPRLARGLNVCPECDHHHRLTAEERIRTLLDAGSAEPLGLSVPDGDPLGFTDLKPYPLRLREARAATGIDEAVVCVRGRIEGNTVIAAVMDFRFLGGSLSGAVGELITQAAEAALRDSTPLVIVTASGGARMQEGAISLMQMAKTSGALGRLDEAGILTISLITDPTFGGVAASYATLCDIILAEPKARMGFAGPRVIEQTLKERLPAEFQTAEFLLRHGMVDAVCARDRLRPTLGRLLSISGGDTSRGFDPTVPDPLVRDHEELPAQDRWETVRKVRDLARTMTLDYVAHALDAFEELHGDRLSADCPAIVGGLGRIGDIPLVVIGHQKGHTAAEMAARNFAMPSPAGYRKSARLMRLAAKLGLPILTLVDTPGAYPGREAEEQGQAVAIAENIRLMSGLPVPTVSIVIGEGGSGGALALAVANRVLIRSDAVYSVISPEGCAAILWKDPAAAPLAADALRLDARELLRLGVVDAVMPTPADEDAGSHGVAATLLRDAVVVTLRELVKLDAAQLVEQRRRRFRRFQSGPAPTTQQGSTS